ncbi:MAG TPA: Xaa-Pro peptidase family protein [Pyrinomonadaceae bacterium]|jgi:Xaa-Pro dipeptidase|nr:Xaa-Pro peptidase family protein [Pyrinomonadaceae bacterium]
MCTDRRDFLRQSAGFAGAALLGNATTAFGANAEIASADPFQQRDLPEAVRKLRKMTDGIVLISLDERRARIEKARRLMREHKIDAIYIEPGPSMFYYTGMRWGTSERMFATVIPARGEIAWVCPKFEEERARELITMGKDIRTWEEDESPYQRVAEIFRDRGLRSGRVGIEERVRFFLYDGIRKAAPGLQFVSATPITAGGRMFKSSAEIALMQRANDMTIVAYRATIDSAREGMTQDEFAANCAAAFRALGVQGGIFCSFGKYTAFPHGSSTPQKLKEGDVVLMDGGCGVEGYQSDITRTFVFGKPTQRQRDIWNLERRSQDAGFAAAKIGAPCEAVDAAARKVITDAGFGPDYRVPGLPHRTGHGIGLDGHEWTNFVRGNKRPIQPGMCFSDEPTIVIYGEFGIRLEDCLYITEQGPKFFTAQSPSIEEPFG